jgi:hypothetical protein
MHRTEGDGYVLESGYRRFVDQDLPYEPGTVLPSEWANAVQEELVNLIESAGLTLETSAANDRTSGWTQLKEAIFESAAIDTAALADGAVTDDKMASCALGKIIWGGSGFDIESVSG